MRCCSHPHPQACPEYRKSNSYRYYSFRQTYLLDIINVLKKAGSSLQEIKDFLQTNLKVCMPEWTIGALMILYPRLAPS
ncbi:MerR family transcriptional regulator [Paenibacillus sp. BAC0078]